MKRQRLMLMVLVAVMSAGVVACGKDEDSSGNAGGAGNAGGYAGGTTKGEWVDLELPSGLLWYSCNLGATSPEEYGDYYAWGETVPKSQYNWSTYRYTNGDDNDMTKYCDDRYFGNHGFTDTLTILQPGDDAAAQVLGGGARMPTKVEMEELLENTTATWTAQNGVWGRKFTGSNGKSLFLPAAGERYGDSLYLAGEYGSYWSASLHERHPSGAWNLLLTHHIQNIPGNGREGGFSVRPVRSAR